MNGRLKYIVFGAEGYEEPQVIVFDQWQDHDASFKRLSSTLEIGIQSPPISAGFVFFQRDPETHVRQADGVGYSMTLNIGHRPQDKKLLTDLLFGNSFEVSLYGNPKQPSLLGSSLTLEILRPWLECVDMCYQGKLGLEIVGESAVIKHIEHYYGGDTQDLGGKLLRCLNHR